MSEQTSKAAGAEKPVLTVFTDTPAATGAARSGRRLGRVAAMVALPALLLAGGGYFWITGGRYEETENANLRQAKVSIASELSGRVVRSDVADNGSVTAGTVLFAIDPEPYRIALAQADAALATARIGVEQLRSAYNQALVQEKMNASEVDYLRSEVERGSDLAGKGISSKSALDDLRHDLAKAEDAHAASVQGLASALAALGGDPDVAADDHPSVKAALAARDKAAYALGQTTVRAPADGVVSQAASFKVGQFVAAGAPVFSLIETGDSWVEANFKETQLARMRVGQPAEIVLDTYPDAPLKATVVGIGAGTGAEFSLLPAQNATGNWVKVTQRIPVRLKVDGGAAGLPMRTGMSATVTVDTGPGEGWPGLLGSAFAGE
ncbi:MAG: HlyD family secretion protein [Rhizobiaceae bacterium]|nr:HlyD family secretion protein [Rhizobiaceae bacterium]